MILALASAHRRFLLSTAHPTSREISHYVKAVSSYQRIMTDLENTGAVRLIRVSAPALFGTSSLLFSYFWVTPHENFHHSIGQVLQLMRNTTKLVRLFWDRPDFAPFQRNMDMTLFPVMITFHAHYHIGTYHRYPALENLAGGKDIYQARPLMGVVEDPKELIDISSMHRLVIFLTVLESVGIKDSTSPTTDVDNTTIAILQRWGFGWLALCDEALQTWVNERNTGAYILMAHYFAGMWRLRQKIWEMCQKEDSSPPAFDNSLTSKDFMGDYYWWLDTTPKTMTLAIANWLGETYRPSLDYIFETIRMLE